MPDRATDWGLFDALSVSVKVAARLPDAAGAKVMVILQLLPLGTLLPQLLLVEKSAASAPPRAI